MTDFNEQFKVFETKLRASVEEYVKNGGRVISDTFEKDGCQCPIACLRYSDPNWNNWCAPLQVIFGSTWDEAESRMWAFVEAFDDECHSEGYPEFSELGRQMREEYLFKKVGVK